MRSIKLALGTAQFGSDYGISNQTGRAKSNEILAILDLAWENGINTLDAAKSYGNSEEAIGNYLKNRPKGSWNIITKVSNGAKKVIDQLQDSDKKLTIHL